jgi:hypothetical protein
MLRLTGRMALAGVMAGALAVSGCATTGSVEKAQATADQAMSAAQAAGAAAQRAQSTADAANAAAMRAQSTADSATSAAQAAASQAQATSTQVQQMQTSIEEMKAKQAARGTKHRRHRKAPAGGGERG